MLRPGLNALGQFPFQCKSWYITERRWYAAGQIVPSLWLINLSKLILVAVSGFATSISLNQLGSCRLVASHGSDQRLDFQWRYIRTLLSKMVSMNGRHMILRSVIFSCTWIISRIVHRKLVILFRIQGVMLHDTPCKCEKLLQVDGLQMKLQARGQRRLGERMPFVYCLVS